MIGGTVQLIPGEVTLAHRGVLIIDELLEFPKQTLESLREPLVNQRVLLHRGGRATSMPADFQLIGTLNPCPCGYQGYADCGCTEPEIARYWSRFSGALADRIDMTISVTPRTTISSSDAHRENSMALRTKIHAAQNHRQQLISEIGNDTSGVASLFASSAWQLLNRAAEYYGWSHRGQASVAFVAISVAALEGHDKILQSDLEEAIAMRSQIVASKASRT